MTSPASGSTAQGVATAQPASGTARAGLEIERLSKRYGSLAAVEDISFRLGKGELLTLLGPSGCGKTTLLRSIGGFVTVDAGRVLINGEDVAPLPPEKRPTATVFQGYALFPHMTVAANVGYGLRMRRVGRAEIDRRVAEALALVQLGAMADRMPSQLSGGQQQRVALARCLVVRPQVLLLDEPFAALDRNLREGMQVELRKLQRQLEITTVVVTHDQEEAFLLSDRVAVMSAGRLHQFDVPAAIYDHPATRFVAGFTGMTNLLEGRVTGAVFEAAGLGRFPLPLQRPAHAPAEGPALLGLRPESLALTFPDDPTASVVGEVAFVAMTGPQALCEIRVGAGSLQVAARRRPVAPKVGERVGVVLPDPTHATVLPA